ncbi:MAG: papain-like cysteine protease family protein [Pyrinomonadaceae bacterium]
MSLRVAKGTPILSPTDAAPLGFDALRAKFEPGSLPIPLQQQSNPVWCYAACASMAINFLHGAEVATQCKVASFVKFVQNGTNSPETCCTGLNLTCIASGCDVDDIGKIFDHWGVDFEQSGNAADPVMGRVDFARLAAELAAKRPVEVVIQWPDEGKHALLVAGIKGNLLFLLDPLKGHPYNGWRTIDSLEDFDEDGQWIKTWPGLIKR